MNDYNLYGKNKVDLVLVHGGPSARGSLKDLAVMLSGNLGVLEINQTKLSIDELVEDMYKYITENCKSKVTLLGHSWGAWLICLYAHKYPETVKKLILVGSGSFNTKYAKESNDLRLSRLDKADKKNYNNLMERFTSKDNSDKDSVMAKFGELMAKLDTYEYEANEHTTLGEVSFQMFNSIWNEAAALRKSSRLLEIMKEIQVPIHIVQGDYDSHNIKGILEPFNENDIECTYDFLEKCGHYPWREKYAKNEFIDIIIREVITLTDSDESN